MPKRTDDPMSEALARLRSLGFEPYQPTKRQLKIGAVSYYPRTGTVFVDREDRRRDETGLDALVAVLRELGYFDYLC